MPGAWFLGAISSKLALLWRCFVARSFLIRMIAVLVLCCLSQAADQRPCTITLDSKTPFLPADYLRVQLTLNRALQSGHYVFGEKDQPDIYIQARPTLPDSPFPLAILVTHRATGEQREAVSRFTDHDAKAGVVYQIASAILSFCPSQAYQQMIAQGRRESPVRVVHSAEMNPVEEPIDQACSLQPLRELSLYSATSSLDVFDLRAALAKEKLAARHNIKAELAPAPGAQVSVKRQLGTSFWRFQVSLPDGEICQRELFIIKDEDAPRRLARALALLVAESQGDHLSFDDIWLERQSYSVRAFGVAHVAQDRPLVLTLGGRDVLLSTPEGLPLVRILADTLQDVSANDFGPSIHSDWDEDLSGCCSDIVSAAVVGAYVTLSNAVSIGRNLFNTEHFLNLAWKEGDTVGQMSFKLGRGDAKKLRPLLEQLVEAGRMAPASRHRAVKLLARGR
jgi:hypothetical protein